MSTAYATNPEATEAPVQRSPKFLTLQVGPRLRGGIAAVERMSHRALEADGLVVDFVTLNPGDGTGSRLQQLGRRASFATRLLLALRTRQRVTLVVNHIGLLRAMPMSRLLRGCEMVLWVYGLELDREDASGLVKRADHILAISEHTAALVRPLMAPHQRLSVVPLAMERHRTPVPFEVVRTREVAAILIVARLDAYEGGKGHNHLIAAMPLVREQHPSAELWIVGDGTDRSRLEELANRHADSGVRFFGHVSDHELNDLYSRASVFAMPSRQEGFGLVYAEAMWHGLPCIASTSDAGQEVVEHGRTGLTVPHGDVVALSEAIGRILSSPVWSSELGEAGRQKAREQYTEDQFGFRLRSALGVAAGFAISEPSHDDHPGCGAAARARITDPSGF